ncbi:unnamed protein product, partial [marine sediment metagenome]
RAVFGGICVALQNVALYDYAVCWHDIVNSVGFEDIKKYVTEIEPDEFELISFKKYAKSEFGKVVHRPRNP